MSIFLPWYLLHEFAYFTFLLLYPGLFSYYGVNAAFW